MILGLVRNGSKPPRRKRPKFGGNANALSALLANLRAAKGLSLREVEEATGKNPHVVMAFSGHRTESMLRRYHMISVEDLRKAAAKGAPIGKTPRRSPHFGGGGPRTRRVSGRG